jgi:hypothetical protein
LSQAETMLCIIYDEPTWGLDTSSAVKKYLLADIEGVDEM